MTLHRESLRHRESSKENVEEFEYKDYFTCEEEKKGEVEEEEFKSTDDMIIQNSILLQQINVLQT